VPVNSERDVDRRDKARQESAMLPMPVWYWVDGHPEKSLLPQPTGIAAAALRRSVSLRKTPHQRKRPGVAAGPSSPHRHHSARKV